MLNLEHCVFAAEVADTQLHDELHTDDDPIAPVARDDVNHPRHPINIMNPIILIRAGGKQMDILDKFSSFGKVIRIIAYIKRFCNRCRHKIMPTNTLALESAELQDATHLLLKHHQLRHFRSEMRSCYRNQSIPDKSKTMGMAPYLDKDDVLRVGGRIGKSNLPHGYRHPIILAGGDRLTHLILHHTHVNTLHGGVQLMLHQIRQSYWIIRARQLIKTHIGRCIKCFRQRKLFATQQMADLPASRVTSFRPFQRCGVDYCGPFTLRASTPRSKITTTGHVAIFVCLATKAVHIEVVSDQTSDAFIAALERFTSRRGNVTHIFSDNGTNFVGAHKILAKDFTAWMDENTLNQLAQKGITWRFNPPNAPHMGGCRQIGKNAYDSNYWQSNFAFRTASNSHGKNRGLLKFTPDGGFN